MKRASYILGIISCLIIFIGSMFKVQHWPGSALMLIVGILSFVLIFLPVSLIHHYNTTAGKKNIWLHIVTFLTGLLVFTSALFKILHWPGAGWILLISIPFPFLVFLPVFIYTSNRNKTPIREYSYILMLLMFYALTSSLLALNISRNVIDEGILSSREWINIEQASILNGQSLITEAKDAHNPQINDLEKIQASGEKLSNEINKILREVVVSVNNSNEQAINMDGKMDFSKLVGLDAVVSGESIFLNGGKGAELRNHIQNYKNMLLSYSTVKNSPTAELIEKLLDTSPNEESAWEGRYLINLHLIWEVNSLEAIKGSIRICETEAMKALLASK
jgi:hypothetical protein